MSSNSKAIIWSAVVVVSIATSVIVLATNRNVSDVTSKDNRPPSAVGLAVNGMANTAASPLPVTAAGPVQMVRFTVFDEGIRPSVAHASPGLVAIYLDDKSAHTAALLLANEQHPLGAINRDTGKLRGHSTMLLTEGTYKIYEANRRNSAATLIVAR